MLISLDFGCDNLEENLANALCKNISLICLNISKEKENALANTLCKNTTLVSLNINHYIRSKDGKVLAKVNVFLTISLIANERK
ncbi:hypothetical protein C2G38_2233019 [Gigaspora rosea]|uniref:Uncharacterized protein n=1 Tax=Gigaspora rosea TaxID=44941 RepID=A0A397U133_9GLOM|nr:hypothetical protein C2G38_2233019 [Gigaspora rosea]